MTPRDESSSSKSHFVYSLNGTFQSEKFHFYYPKIASMASNTLESGISDDMVFSSLPAK